MATNGKWRNLFQCNQCQSSTQTLKLEPVSKRVGPRGYQTLKCFYWLVVLLILNVNELYSSTLLDQEFEKFFNKFPTMETKTILARQRRNSPNTSSHKLTAGMKFTGSAKPDKIKKNRWTNSILAYEHSPRIVNLQKTI